MDPANGPDEFILFSEAWVNDVSKEIGNAGFLFEVVRPSQSSFLLPWNISLFSAVQGKSTDNAIRHALVLTIVVTKH